MEIKVNNECRIIDAGMTVGQLVDSDTVGVAVAINGRIVKKEEWATRTLEAGDDVVIIRAAYGG